ncbi:hypothetical protein K440DRAFT_659911 [Wilcoxina mikolae CBS 423.85]|nr:hypothetical protein K440DRAFT_659911 [Wilcoxina mikolae CBS 423.85]
MPKYIPPKANRGITDDPLWLYRHLIRQARALYDDVARTWYTGHIRRRFEENHRLPSSQRTVQLIREARHGVTQLAKANAGVTKSLTKVLESGYGRIGKRRHDLLKPILVHGKPVVEGDDPRLALPFTSEPFRALLVWANVKNINVKIPETNIWNQPFPKVREPRKLRLAHSKLVKVCPAPLPMDEYERLKRFANGEEMPKPSPRKVELQLVTKIKSGEVLVDPELGRPHDMTPRSWRRMWQRVLAQTPALHFNAEGKKWEVISTDTRPDIPDGKLEEFDITVDEESTEESICK